MFLQRLSAAGHAAVLATTRRRSAPVCACRPAASPRLLPRGVADPPVYTHSLAMRQRCRLSRPPATGTPEAATEDLDECEENFAGDYCALDAQGKRITKRRTLGEMENEFLLALSSWYFDGRPSMTNEEFEVLREELLWAGSKVAILDDEEQRFLNASMAFSRGQPIMSDDEYDELKTELKAKASVVTAQGPRCSIRSKRMYADAEPDYLRMIALNLPAALLVLGFVFAIDDLTGFEITKAIELPPPISIVGIWGLLLPAVVAVSFSLTNLLFRDFVVLKAPCPSCGEPNFTYFGSIFTVASNRGQNSVECSSCKALLTFDELKRVVVVGETSEDRQQKAAAAAAKRAAAASKKAARAAKTQ